MPCSLPLSAGKLKAPRSSLPQIPVIFPVQIGAALLIRTMKHKGATKFESGRQTNGQNADDVAGPSTSVAIRREVSTKISVEEPSSRTDHFATSDWERQFLAMRRTLNHAFYHDPPIDLQIETTMNRVFREISHQMRDFVTSSGSRIIRHDGLCDDALELSGLMFPSTIRRENLGCLMDLSGWLRFLPVDILRSFTAAALTQWFFQRHLGSPWHFSRYLHEDLDDFLIKGTHNATKGRL
jgi:hypothetical protein